MSEGAAWPHGLAETGPCTIDGKVYLEQSIPIAPPRIARDVMVLWYDGETPRGGTVVCNSYPDHYRVVDWFGAEHKVPTGEVWIAESKWAQATMHSLVSFLKLEITDKNVDTVLRDHPLLYFLYLAYIEYTNRYRETADRYRPASREHRRVGFRPPAMIGRERNGVYDGRASWLCWLFKRSHVHRLPAKIAETLSREYHGLPKKET